jgi:hypothetical protein
MSALPPKADMFSIEIDVCFVPIADITSVIDNFDKGGQLRAGLFLCRSRA